MGASYFLFVDPCFLSTGLSSTPLGYEGRISLLVTPQEASSLLVPHLLVVHLENWDVLQDDRVRFPGYRLDDVGARKRGSINLSVEKHPM